MERPFPEPVMFQTVYWARYFADEWRTEVPTRIHSSEIGADGAPQWHPSFEKWLARGGRGQGWERPDDVHLVGESRLRTTRALRQLRKCAVREYEVLYRILILADSIDGVTVWLNERATRNSIPLPDGKDTHYSEKDTWALFIAGVDFVRQAY